jgi:hypothetical protein
LEGFERQEFDRLIKFYGLPGGLPFAELRHPIVFRLMVEAHKQGRTGPLRIRELFDRYLTELVVRIHARLLNRSKERINKLLESWTALPQTAALGYIEAAGLVSAEDEAIAEAAVAEGLLEHVPCGYRYVYDEISDFVRARTLSEHLVSLSANTDRPILVTIDELLKGGCTPGSVARALEILSDVNADAFRALAQRLAAELKAANGIDPLGSWSTVRGIFGVIRVLALVEKGGPFDVAKDRSPIFWIGSSETENGWSGSGLVPYLISTDHISYAFNEDQIWRLIKLAAASDADRDSYPFRWKDIRNDGALETARRELNTREVFKVVRHFITGFPEAALKRLSAGLADERRIGREHSFGSFCAQAICVFADRFDLSAVLRTFVQHSSCDGIIRIFRLYPDASLAMFFQHDMGFIKQPSLCADVLLGSLAAMPDKAGTIERIAAELITTHNHPLSAYSSRLPKLKEALSHGSLGNKIRTEWLSGQSDLRSLAQGAAAGLISWDEMFDLMLDRLRRADIDLYSFVSPLGYLWDTYDYFTRSGGRLRLIVAAISEGFPLFTDDHVYAAEAFLYVSLKQGLWEEAVKNFVERVSRENPERAASSLRYTIASGDFDRVSEDEQAKISDDLIACFRKEDLITIIDLCMERIPDRFVAKYFIRSYIKLFGSTDLFEISKERVAHCKSHGFPLLEEWRALIQHLSQFDPEGFQRYKSWLS